MTARQELPELLQRHSEHLQASAISIEVIRERGYRSVSRKGELGELGFSKSQQRVPSPEANIANLGLKVGLKVGARFNPTVQLNAFERAGVQFQS